MNGPVRFKSLCPVLDCNNADLIYWKHAGCSNGTETLDSEGDVKCEQCGLKDFIMNWKYQCQKCQNGYECPDPAKIGKVLGALTGKLQSESEIGFILKVILKINTRNGIA
jgi:hypothetical protein